MIFVKLSIQFNFHSVIGKLAMRKTDVDVRYYGYRFDISLSLNTRYLQYKTV